ncbi:MAG: hypothetical protein KBA30_07960 [Clostridia bacterium]|nr:hypothetical protein [Clostridia bacterium]
MNLFGKKHPSSPCNAANDCDGTPCRGFSEGENFNRAEAYRPVRPYEFRSPMGLSGLSFGSAGDIRPSRKP